LDHQIETSSISYFSLAQVDNEDDCLECAQGIEKMLEDTKI